MIETAKFLYVLARKQLCYVNFLDQMDEGPLFRVNCIFVDMAWFAIDRLMPSQLQRFVFEAEIGKYLVQMTVPVERCHVSVDLGDVFWCGYYVKLRSADFHSKRFMRAACVVTSYLSVFMETDISSPRGKEAH